MKRGRFFGCGALAVAVVIRVGRGALAAVIRVGGWWCVGSGWAVAAVIRVER